MKSENDTRGFSLSEFVQEEALLPRRPIETALEIVRARSQAYRFPDDGPAPDDVREARWELIRRFFRTGIVTETQETAGDVARSVGPEHLVPVLLAPLLTGDEPVTDFPIFLGSDGGDPRPVPDLLNDVFRTTFRQNEADVLLGHLPRMASRIRHWVGQHGNDCAAQVAFDDAAGDLAAIRILGKEGDAFRDHVRVFRDRLPDGSLMGFSHRLPFRLLAHTMKRQAQGAERSEYIRSLQRLKNGLAELLAVERSKSPDAQDAGHGDFTDAFIETNALDALMPERASEPMAKSRHDRIVRCLRILQAAEKWLQHPGILYIGGGLAENPAFAFLRDDPAFSGFDVRIAPKGAGCKALSSGAKAHLAGMNEMVASARMAGLEVRNQYREAIHDDYFSRFNWLYFTDEETGLCPPVVLIDETGGLLGDEMAEFSRLISSNMPVKILAVRQPETGLPELNGSDTETPVCFRQELSAVAVSHRNTFTHQGTASGPMHLAKGIAQGLAAPSPALIHVLIPDPSGKPPDRAFLEISAAVESREFPLFTYDVRGTRWGSRFDVHANPQPDRDWVRYAVDTGNGGEARLEADFTPADLLALYRSGLDKLMPVPPPCWTDDLIDLSEYLRLPADKLYAKVPFIWLADGNRTLHKAAVPHYLVIAARERLDFWNYLQELGGVNNYHVEQAVLRTRQELLDQKTIELKDLEALHLKQLEEARATAAEDAMSNLASMLLDLDADLALPQRTPGPARPPSDTVSPPGNAGEPEDGPAQAVEADATPQADPWVDTARCTSCNECTDKYPRAFKYNDDKQAYLDDPTTVTYAQLVKAAEDCPAKCIHPGLPMNPDEPGLQELAVRAKPFL